MHINMLNNGMDSIQKGFMYYSNYNDSIYNMPERSVAADRQARYRERKKKKSQIVE